ncbi:hypothetical protein GYMLUDRAFT_33854 [Collybiopsis luxurians FD-317 M1]|nr:hypothetical protein GYMLUDRAFT_33854 [Collybiopsis luxurians FD-317 M1]
MDKERDPPQQQPDYHPTATKSRAPEFYGFVALSSTSFLFVVYVLWALLPDEWIIRTGIEWYPNREWSLLLPSYSMILVLLTYFTYMALTIYGTPAFSERKSLLDSRAQYPPPVASLRGGNGHECPIYDQNALFASYSKYAGTWGADENVQAADSELYDIPIELVNKVAYG